MSLEKQQLRDLFTLNGLDRDWQSLWSHAWFKPDDIEQFCIRKAARLKKQNVITMEQMKFINMVEGFAPHTPQQGD